MFVRVKAFLMYGGMGVSAPSLHRESTDSLIYCKGSYKRMLSGSIVPGERVMHFPVRGTNINAFLAPFRLNDLKLTFPLREVREGVLVYVITSCCHL